MYRRSLRRPAVIVDVDGTLCDVTDALASLFELIDGEKNYAAFHGATVNAPPYQDVLDYCTRCYDQGYTVVIVTAREETWRELTVEWLDKHMPCFYDGPFMRAEGDRRPDDQVKREIYHYLTTSYDIRGAIDDSPRVIKLWEELGIPVVVAPGHQNWLDSHARD